MKFADFIVTDAVRSDLQAGDKDGVIEELIVALVKASAIKEENQSSVVDAVMKREELGSTGIGRGVAVPHTKHPSVDRLIGTVGISREGVDFNSLDGEMVHIFFLLVSPPDRPGDHLRALENISRKLRDDTFCRFLRQAGSVKDITQLLDEADNNQL
jgi:PTS system fructose-specific IIA component/PTS system nitrogen regulatory IIA component